VQTIDPRERGAIELPGTITVKELADLLSVNVADVIRELIKSGIFATINQLIDRDTASLVASELGYEVAETVAASTNGTGLREERCCELGLERPAQGALGDGDG
jgi:translation initiation factor IF-2